MTLFYRCDELLNNIQTTLYRTGQKIMYIVLVYNTDSRQKNKQTYKLLAYEIDSI